MARVVETTPLQLPRERLPGAEQTGLHRPFGTSEHERDLGDRHAERMAAIEKGIELPPLPDGYFSGGDTRSSGPAKPRRTGLVLLFLGIGITLALWGSGVVDALWWLGVVPLALGVAFLLAAWFEARELQKNPSHAD